MQFPALVEETLMRLKARRQAAAFNLLPAPAPSKIGPDIEAAPPPPPMQMQMPPPMADGGSPFGALLGLGAARAMRGLMKKVPDTSGISTARESARASTPGFMGGAGALTPAGTQFLAPARVSIDDALPTRKAKPGAFAGLKF
jgi:hypothetical protein